MKDSFALSIELGFDTEVSLVFKADSADHK